MMIGVDIFESVWLACCGADGTDSLALDARSSLQRNLRKRMKAVAALVRTSARTTGTLVSKQFKLCLCMVACSLGSLTIFRL